MTCELGFVYFLSDLVVWPATPPGHPITQIYFPKNVSASNPGPASKKKTKERKKLGNLTGRITGKTKKKKACVYMNVHGACFFLVLFFLFFWSGVVAAPPWVCLRLYCATHRCIHVLQKDSVRGAENWDVLCSRYCHTHTHTHTHRRTHFLPFSMETGQDKRDAVTYVMNNTCLALLWKCSSCEQRERKTKCCYVFVHLAGFPG